jgi:tRNA (cmo5U34)-methyltransferase
MAKSDNPTPHSAEVYDVQVRKIIPCYDAFHDETINLIKAIHNEPKKWLDTGCGTGTLVRRALSQFPKTHFILADPSKEMLNTARRKLENVASGRVQFLEPITTQGLPRNLASLDVITAVQSHHYISAKERIKATAVCFELLKQRGVYVTFENIRPLTNEGITIGKEIWKNFQLSQGRDSTTVERHLERFDVEYYPITIEEHLSILRKTGFSTVEMLWYSYMQAGFYAIK